MSPRGPAAQIREWTAEGRRVALATVVGVTRSAPRPLGAKLAVAESGESVGAVSGGCVEGAVISAARELLDRGGAPRLLRFGIDDEEALGVGLPCGGEIDVLLELAAAHELDGFLAAEADGEPAALITVLDGEGRASATRLDGDGDAAASATSRGADAKVLVGGDGSRRGTLGAPDLDAAALALAAERIAARRPGSASILGRDLFCDVVVAAPRLLIFGAVDYAAALCRLAAESGWRPFVIDPRRAFADPGRFAAAERVVSAWPRAAIEKLGGIDATTAVVVLTHDAKLDDEALAAALESPARFIGAMGSRLSCERRSERLRQAGFSSEAVARISAPVGLDLGGGSATETALSIFAEIVAVANGRGGGRLAEADGPIHAVA
jgi:xanthine dehydrogenase accessory factor